MVSIIMPAYNASKFIQESIDSVLSQTYKDWELIIVDDGSTDNTNAIVNKNLLRDERIKLFFQENGKQGKARNIGIKNSSGDFIAFLDADDIWMPNKLETQLKEIELYQADLVFSDAYIFSKDFRGENDKKLNTLKSCFQGLKAVDLFLLKNQIPILTVLVRKSKVLEVDCFTENIEIQNAEDYHLWLKMLLEGFSFYGSNHTLAAYRMHSSSNTSKDPLAILQKIEAYKNLKSKYPDFREKFLKAIKENFTIYYRQNNLSKGKLNNLIDKNCIYLEKNYQINIFKFSNKILGARATINLLNIFLNERK